MNKLFHSVLFKLLTLCLSVSLVPISSASEPALVANGLEIPWGMTWLDDDQLLVTERQGTVTKINVTTGEKLTITGGPDVYHRGQGGLLDVYTEQPYQPGNWIYFSYAKPVNGEGVTTLARARIKNTQLSDWQDLLITDSATSTTRHYGSRIAINGEYLFFSVGERGHRPNSQNLSNHAGKILRLYKDGKVPSDNPFSTTPNARPEIWSYGHRNPQGLCFDKADNLWESEHGPRGGDEVNLVIKGANYGWPEVSYGKEYFLPKAVGEATEKPGVESPRKVYIPSIAPSSMICSTAADGQSLLLLGALTKRHINKLTIGEDLSIESEERLLEESGWRIRSLTRHQDGSIYFATDSGEIYKLGAL